MKRSVLLCAFLFMVLCVNASAQTDEEKQHPIDVALAKCLEGKHATMPRAECYSTAEEAWEKSVKTNYLKVLKAVPSDLAPSLRTNQLAWETYRRSIEQFYAAKSSRQKGTGFIAARIIQNINIWKPRALFLENLLETYKN